MIFRLCYRKMFLQQSRLTKIFEDLMRMKGPHRHVQYRNLFFYIVSLFSILVDFHSSAFADLRQKTEHQ